jgi:hypothetical protein
VEAAEALKTKHPVRKSDMKLLYGCILKPLERKIQPADWQGKPYDQMPWVLEAEALSEKLRRCTERGRGARAGSAETAGTSGQPGAPGDGQRPQSGAGRRSRELDPLLCLEDLPPKRPRKSPTRWVLGRSLTSFHCPFCKAMFAASSPV